MGQVEARHFRMVSTPASKYAHAPSSMAGKESRWWGPAACGITLKNYDPYDPTHDHYADGKPPCPRCLSALEWHIEWTQGFMESYRELVTQDG